MNVSGLNQNAIAPDIGTEVDNGNVSHIQVIISNPSRKPLFNNRGHINPNNLKQLTQSSRWDIPAILNVNARSLSTDKMDELLVVAKDNAVSVICVTETWFSDYVPDEAVALPGFYCERRDRTDRRGGGVACYIKCTIQYDHLSHLNDDIHEVLWIRLKPHKLPRKFSCILVGCIYHPPDADDMSMHDYLITCVDNIFRKYPYAGIILTGDFNRLSDNFLKTHYGFNQIVTSATRSQTILDKVWTNMAMMYDQPTILSELGTSDHNMVLVLPCDHSTLETGSIQRTLTRRTGLQEKIHFADELAKIRWEPLFHLNTCEEQFAFYQNTMDRLMRDCFPLRTVTRQSADKPWDVLIQINTNYFKHCKILHFGVNIHNCT